VPMVVKTTTVKKKDALNSKKRGHCVEHGGTNTHKKCGVNDCDNIATKDGVCCTHGAKVKSCSVENCNKQARKGGYCTKHHPDYVQLMSLINRLII